MPTVTMYSCATCNQTMIAEVFADAATTRAIIEQNPSCNDCSALCPDCEGQNVDGHVCYDCCASDYLNG